MIAQLYKDACGKKEYMSKTRSFALFLYLFLSMQIGCIATNYLCNVFNNHFKFIEL